MPLLTRVLTLTFAFEEVELAVRSQRLRSSSERRSSESVSSWSEGSEPVLLSSEKAVEEEDPPRCGRCRRRGWFCK